MTTREAAAHYSVSVSTIRRWIKQGKLNAEKRGRRWFILPKKTVPVVPEGSIVYEEWPWYVDRHFAEKDGRRPDEFKFDQWPISDLIFKHAHWADPSDIGFRYRCEITPDVPQPNRYVTAEERLPGVEYEPVEDGMFRAPDPTGMALSRVKFQLREEDSRDKLDESVSSPVHGESTVHAGVGTRAKLFKRLKRGTTLRVYVEAFPLFFYLTADGAAHLEYANMGQRGYFKGDTLRTRVHTIHMNEYGDLFLDGEPQPEAPPVQPSAEDIASREESERIIREEREERERLAREDRERVEREKREHAKRMERERREQEAAQRKARDEADAQARREREEYERQKREAAAERARLGIKDKPKRTAPRSAERQSIEDYYESQLKGTLGDEGQDISDDLYRHFLVRRVKPMGGKIADAADEILKEKGWS